MKTIIFVGSPKRDGHTMTLVKEVMKYIQGDVEVINAFDYGHIKPCIDCGYCTRKPGCSIKDGFDEILKKIEEADAYIIAAPMWLGGLPGPLLSLFSRLQTVSCGLIFRKDIVHKWDKAGLFLMTTGAKWHSMSKAVETNVEFIFSHMDAGICDFIYSTDTDHIATHNNIQALKRCELAAHRINQWYQDKNSGKFYKYFYSSVNYLKITETPEV